MEYNLMFDVVKPCVWMGLMLTLCAGCVGWLIHLGLRLFDILSLGGN